MKIAVIGGGVSGCMAALTVAKRGIETHLFEKNEKLLKKMFITGKGRCNLTNYIGNEEFLQNVVSNPKFLYSSLGEFDCYSTYAFFEDLGVRLKVEHGNRVFPESDKSSDITRAFARAVERGGVIIHLQTEVKKLEKRDVFYVDGKPFDCVIVASGGASYPKTGSTGDGYKFAKAMGHTIVEIKPALVGVSVAENVSALAGLTLKNISLSCYYGERKLYSKFGELLFTHTGISGPTVLSLSSHINRISLRDVSVAIDLKPALSSEELDKRLQSDFAKNINKAYKNSLDELLPRSLISQVVLKSGIDENKPVHQITAKERECLVSTLKAFRLKVTALGKIDEAIITAGGIKAAELNPKSMESKLCKGLYFTGEVIDIDALTGGYNIQIALSTGYAAGNHVC